MKAEIAAVQRQTARQFSEHNQAAWNDLNDLISSSQNQSESRHRSYLQNFNNIKAQIAESRAQAAAAEERALMIEDSVQLLGADIHKMHSDVSSEHWPPLSCTGCSLVANRPV